MVSSQQSHQAMSNAETSLSFEALGESAMLLNLSQRIDPAISARAQQLSHALRQARLPGIHDIVPAYASVLLRFDPAVWARLDRLSPHAALQRAVEPLCNADAAPAAAAAGQVHELPVCYGGEHGVDLDSVAERCGLSPDQLVERHSASEYHVAMLGFAPGFAYLLGLDPALQVPRRDTPRTRVPAGSVGIGGAQTGIYPRQLPGGWQLLGRTPTRLFDAAHGARPALLQAGDRVRFVPITRQRFQALAGEGGDA